MNDDSAKVLTQRWKHPPLAAKNKQTKKWLCLLLSGQWMAPDPEQDFPLLIHVLFFSLLSFLFFFFFKAYQLWVFEEIFLNCDTFCYPWKMQQRHFCPLLDPYPT